MSKAFTREDDAGAEEAPLRPLVTLPAGAKNYVTPEGEQGLRRELETLVAERASVAAAKDRARANSLDQRIARLEQIIASLTVVAPAAGEEVRFGARVTVEYPSKDVETFRIVGVNEIDLERNHISWQSPLARALTGAKAGDVVTFKAPAGEQRLRIVAVDQS